MDSLKQSINSSNKKELKDYNITNDKNNDVVKLLDNDSDSELEIEYNNMNDKNNNNRSTDIINKGTSAGGSRTNHNGLKFEEKTSAKNLLISMGFKKKVLHDTFHYYYYQYSDKIIVYVCKKSFKFYMERRYSIRSSDIFREPDEAFIVKYNNDNNIIVYIMETKNQNREGSVYDKLFTGVSYVGQYNFMLNGSPHVNRKKEYTFIIRYGYCICRFLKSKYLEDTPKQRYLRNEHSKNKIIVLYGDDDDYFERLMEWINTGPYIKKKYLGWMTMWTSIQSSRF